MTTALPADFHIWATCILVVLSVVAFASDRIRVEVSGLSVLVVLILLFEIFPLTPRPGAEPVDTARLIAGFANPALIAVMALLVLGHGLSRTGALDWVLTFFLSVTGDHRILALGVSFAAVFIASAFVNNTPIVIIFIPIPETIPRRFDMAPGTVMMPLSFIAVLAGMTTLIGSSTNLLVSGALVESGLAPLGFFDFTVPGLVLAAVGAVYLGFIAPRLLRGRSSAVNRFTTGAHRRFVAQIDVGAESKLVGAEAAFNTLGIKGARLILVQRHEHSNVPPFNGLTLQAGDTLVVLATSKALGEAKTTYPHLKFNMSGEDLPEKESEGESDDKEEGDTDPATTEENEKDWRSREQLISEVMIAPGSRFVGHTLEDIGFHQRFGCLVLGLQRRSHIIRRRLTGSAIREGDVLVIQGTREALEGIRAHRGLVMLDGATRPLPPARAAEIAGMIFLATVVVASTGLLPIVAAALTGVALMLLTGVLTTREAVDAMDRRIFLMVAASLGLSIAMMETGAAAAIAHGAIDLIGGAGPAALLSVLFLLVALLTNVLSNNASAVLFTPIALGLAQGLGANPTPFVMAVLFGANCSFATPIGYQTNLLVMGPGHYRFADFLRVGGPLVLVVWVAFSLFAPFYWDLPR